jgi:hypothetical protein
MRLPLRIGTVEFIMRNGLVRAGLIAAAVALTSPLSWSQSGYSSTGSSQTGVVSGLSNPSQGSGGSAPLNSTVSASVANVSSASLIGSSLSNASISEQVSGGPEEGSSGTVRLSGLAGSGGAASQASRETWGAGRGWGHTSGSSSMAVALSPIASMPSTGQRTSGGLLQKTAKGSSGTASLHLSAQAGLAVAGKHPSISAGSAGQRILSQLGSMSNSHGNGLSPSINKEEQGSGTAQGTSGAMSGMSYTDDFPDSTKNTAVISPPDPANAPVFAFSPGVGVEFPDLSQYQFLMPSLHIGGESATGKDQEDLYKRIERRLREYEQGAKGTSVNNGLKENKLSNPGYKDPFARRKLDNGLKNAADLGLTH